MSGPSHFVDYVRLTVKAGDGGDGCVAFLREKYVPHGGPAGGDGGRGGSVYLQADSDLATLLDLKMRPHWVAGRGGHGEGKNRSGRGAKDITLNVPLGTTVIDEETGEELGDLTYPGQRLLVAAGGKGGLGNQHFANPTNKAPRKWTAGKPGEERRLILELKVIADGGLVGLPNAGKSTLLGAMTSASPRIGSYPFTTLSPNLGVFVASDYQQRITLADIPGLIEGAHTGAGLGDRFLRHIERTKILVHLVAPEAGETAEGELTVADADPETLLYAYDLVEDELRQYSQRLLIKPRVVCLSKIDLLKPEEVDAIVAAFRERGVKLLPISATTRQGLDVLQQRIEEVVLALLNQAAAGQEIAEAESIPDPDEEE